MEPLQPTREQSFSKEILSVAMDTITITRESHCFATLKDVPHSLRHSLRDVPPKLTTVSTATFPGQRISVAEDIDNVVALADVISQLVSYGDEIHVSARRVEIHLPWLRQGVFRPINHVRILCGLWDSGVWRASCSITNRYNRTIIDDEASPDLLERMAEVGIGDRDVYGPVSRQVSTVIGRRD